MEWEKKNSNFQVSGNSNVTQQNQRKLKPELLAPAGEMDALKAAVENGADAVYLGGKAFSARASAANFSHSELAEAVEYAHLRGVKVYVAVNTLVDNQEMTGALEYAFFLHQIGVDALIIQDLGLLFALRRILPELKLHASTQMTIHNVEGVRFLANWGVDRIVLAREVSLAQIAQIHAQTRCELEVFIHGALCISYSGQCLLSSFIGGRSGNRGRCAQPCRLAYSLEQSGAGLTKLSFKGEASHLLSTRDLNSLEFLPQLIEAGVSSLKIEGRMKRPEYVATVVRIYRQALDRFYDNPAEFQVYPEEKRELEQIFNRDFTPGYLLGNPGGNLMSPQRPNNRGVYLGRITHYDRQSRQARIKLEDTLRCGDGIEIWVTKGGRQGLTVHKLLVKGTLREEAHAGEEAIIAGEAVTHPGDRVFKTYDGQLMTRALESFRQIQRRIPLRVKIKAAVGEPLVLEAVDPENNQCRVATEFIGQVAERRPLTRDLIYQHLNRLGNTVFSLDQLEFDLAPNVIVPVSALNQIRRKMVAELEQKRLTRARGPQVSPTEFRDRLREAPKLLEPRPVITRTSSTIEVAQGERSPIKRTKPVLGNMKTAIEATSFGRDQPCLSVAVGDLASAWEALVAGADQIYLPAVSFRSKAKTDQPLLDKLVESGRQRKVRLLATLPRIMAETDRDRVLRRIEDWENIAREGAPYLGWLVGNLGGIELLLDRPKHLRYADYSLNCFNNHAVQILWQLGFNQVTLSPELNYAQLKAFALKPAALEVIVHGSWPLMISEHCGVGAVQGRRTKDQACLGPCPGQHFYLKDRLGFLFPVEMDEFCRMYLYNPKVLDLIDNLERLVYLGFGSLRLEVRRESPEYVRETVQVYREELNRLQELLVKQAGSGRFDLNGRRFTDNGFNEPELRYAPLAANRERLKRLAPVGLTRGHFFRGVVAVD